MTSPIKFGIVKQLPWNVCFGLPFLPHYHHKRRCWCVHHMSTKEYSELCRWLASGINKYFLWHSLSIDYHQTMFLLKSSRLAQVSKFHSPDLPLKKMAVSSVNKISLPVKSSLYELHIHTSLYIDLHSYTRKIKWLTEKSLSNHKINIQMLILLA